MKLDLTEEQKMLCDSVDKLMQAESSMARVRAAESSGFDARLWQQLLKMGILSMRVPESQGGGGMGLLDAVLIAERAGAHLASVPLAETLPASALLARLDGQTAARYLADALDGDVVVLHPRELREDELPVLSTAANVTIALRGEHVLALRNLVRTGDTGYRPNLGSEALAIFGQDDISVQQVVARGPAARAAFMAALVRWWSSTIWRATRKASLRR